MKVDIKEAVVESSTSFGKSVDMGISKNGVAHLMSLLTNLYNDPELAVIREYFSNALDSHARIGQTRPVDIYLPTRDNPLFVVKDYGVGMTALEIEEIYSQYGESTKRNSNKEIGAFGLGAKSALAIATQFTLTSIKGGMKTTALVSKTETGINNVDILPSKKTEEAHGTTVTIPVPHVSSFLEKVTEYFKYVDPELVLINGHKPTSVLADATKLLDLGVPGVEIYTSSNKRSWHSSTYKIIMGNVPYTITEEELRTSLRRRKLKFDISVVQMNLYIIVGIGDVDLTPSREGLRFTDKTNDRIDEIMEKFVTSIRKTAIEEIEAVQDRHLVFEALNEWSDILGHDYKTWHGEEVVSYISLPSAVPVVNRYESSAEHGTKSRIPTNSKPVVVHGRDISEYRKVGAYLGAYLKYTDRTHGYFVFVNDLTGFTSKWATENKNFSFISADKLVEAGKEQRRIDRAAAKQSLNKTAPKKYAYPVLDLVNMTASLMPYDTIPVNTPYLDGKEFSKTVGESIARYFNGYNKPGHNYHREKEMATAIAPFTSSKHVILVGGSLKVSALMTRIPTSYNIVDDYQKAVNKVYSNVSEEIQNLAASKGSRLANMLDHFTDAGIVSTLLDADLKSISSPSKKTQEELKSLQTYEAHLKVVKPDASVYTLPTNSDVLNRLHAKYPLISCMSYYNMAPKQLEHVVKYLNSVHSETLTSTV